VVPFLDRGLRLYDSGVPELVAPTRLSAFSAPSSLSRDISNLTSFPFRRQAFSFQRFPSASANPKPRFDQLEAGSLNQNIALRKSLKERPAHKTLEPLGLTRDKSLGSNNGLFSVGFPTGVTGDYSPDPTNQLSTSLIGQAIQPPEGSTATYRFTATFQEYQTSSTLASLSVLTASLVFLQPLHSNRVCFVLQALPFLPAPPLLQLLETITAFLCLQEASVFQAYPIRIFKVKQMSVQLATSFATHSHSSRCNFPRISTPDLERKLSPCGKLVFLWETSP